MAEDKKYQKGVNPVAFIFYLVVAVILFFFVRLWGYYDYSTNQQSRVVLIALRII